MVEIVATSQLRLGLPATASSYTELGRLVRESGLLDRCRGYYWRSIAAAVSAVVVVVVVVVRLGNSWWQLVPAAVLGGVLTQVGFLAHDAAHRQIFASRAWNEWTARLLSGALLGLSYSWWRSKHNRHHAAPNQIGRDPDIDPGLLAFTSELATARSTGARGWFTRHQGWLLFPLLTLEGLSLHVAGVRSLLASHDRHRALELALIAGRVAAVVTLLLLVLPVGKAAAFLGLQVGVFGLLLGGSFAPNHTGMPTVPRDLKIDFLRRQVLMSRNVRANPVIDAAMGGLNYQIEHHLFPSMPRPHLKLVRPLVRDYCAERDIPYTELGLCSAYAAVIGYLNHVGLRARAPFDCPLAAEWRS